MRARVHVLPCPNVHLLTAAVFGAKAMCISPTVLNDGQTAACRKCWQCLEHRVDNWVGRCIAESKTSVVSCFITLTYGRDENDNVSHANAAILTYSDCQKYFKQLRNRGLKFRYFVVGEVSEHNTMRSHWHIIVFFQEHLPDGFWDYGVNSWHREKREHPVYVPLVWNKRFNEPCWPHGFSQWETLRNGTAKGSVRYACKYINKDVDDESAQSKLCMSKKPPIGALYFDQRAQRFVDEGIAPQDAIYTFPGEADRKTDGKPIKFRLANKSSDLFCENYILRWRGLPKPWGRQGPPIYTGRPWHYPESEYVQEFEDRMYSDRFVTDPEFLKWYREHKQCPNETTEETKRVMPVAITQREWLQARSKRTQLADAPGRTPLFVLWIKSASEGRWKTAKTRTENDKPVWLKSQMS
jgi:hypothetical protein